MAEYFYTDAEGKIRGPVPYKKLHAMAAFGSVPHDARVMKVGVQADAGGEQPWRPIAEVLPPDTMPDARRPERKSGKVWAACSFALGAVVFMVAGIGPMCLALPAGAAAAVCGIVAITGGRSESLTSGSKAMAIIGLVLGCIGVLAGMNGLTTILFPAQP